MRTFALFAIMAAFANAQGTDDQIPNIDELLDNREGDALISPAPDMGKEEGEGSSDPREEINGDLQAGLDWVMDLHNTFCSGGDDKDGGEIDLSKLKPEEIAEMASKGEISPEDIAKWQTEQE